MNDNNLQKKLSPLNVCSLALGCIIGWGAFIMPGTVFLPKAGPHGTAIAIVMAMIIMIIIAISYAYMVNKYPYSGGECIYALNLFGRKHAFICGWFLCLSYLAIVPLNATAISLLARNLLGDIFRKGISYQVVGYDVYFGEIIIAEIVLVLFAIISIRGVKMVGIVQTLLCFMLVFGVLLIVVTTFLKGNISESTLIPSFVDSSNKLSNILAVLAVAPWAFIGFDTIPQATEEFGFPLKKTICLMITAIIFGGLVYIALNYVTAIAIPDEYDTWYDYIVLNGANHVGIEALPTFNAAYLVLGKGGLIILGVAILGAILSGILGFFMATSRLLYAMSKENFIPQIFGRINEKYGTPAYAIIFVLIISMIAPFFGRTVLGWIVDMSSLGAAIGFGYTAFSAMILAYREKNKFIMLIGSLGCFFSVVFAILLLVPIPQIDSSLSIESYIMLIIWLALGVIFVFNKGRKER